MIVQSVTLKRPAVDRPSIAFMATVVTDAGTFVFAAMLSTQINCACFRFNGMFLHAFELLPADAQVCHAAIREAIENKRAQEYLETADTKNTNGPR